MGSQGRIPGMFLSSMGRVSCLWPRWTSQLKDTLHTRGQPLARFTQREHPRAPCSRLAWVPGGFHRVWGQKKVYPWAEPATNSPGPAAVPCLHPLPPAPSGCRVAVPAAPCGPELPVCRSCLPTWQPVVLRAMKCPGSLWLQGPGTIPNFVSKGKSTHVESGDRLARWAF